MKTSPWDSFQIAIVLAVLSLLTSGSLAHAATITWTNTSGGNWSVANNWSPNQVPTNADVVLITTPGTCTEWCWDCYGNYSSASQTDPRGPTSGQDGSFRVFRGGCYSLDAFGCRAALRNYFNPTVSINDIGFRSVLPWANELNDSTAL